jgi:flagellum-specific ATP synthase
VFESHRHILAGMQPLGVSGRVADVRGLTAAVADFPAAIGSACRIASSPAAPRGASIRADEAGVDARVVGFVGNRTLVMPMGPMTGIRRGDRVVFRSSAQAVGVGSALLGRILNGRGEPIDGRGPFPIEARVPLWPPPISPLERRRLSTPLATGVRALDAMLTAGRGQRMGILSGSGVGKSVLLGMIGRYTSADVNVIALIGERGREVRDFLERDLGAAGLARSVVVASTSDEPPLVRVQAAAVAAAVAEYFRDRGRDVLLLMDSLTRLAASQRMVGLASGEPPATKGYPPSVFNLLPELLERSGRTAAGSITGFYTVLVEGDDMSDPLGDAVRAVTDGHIWLSRDLFQQGHLPAVDVLGSISRVMDDVAGVEHRRAAGEVRRLLAAYAEVEDLVRVGAYRPGASAETDRAVQALPQVRAFLAQKVEEPSAFDRTVGQLHELVRRITQPRRGPAAVRPAPRAGT